jgi:hypothetical protein
MIKPDADKNSPVNKLIALWAFTEAGLGGLMHAFNSPFTGVFIGGMAVVVLTLIATFSDFKPAATLRALSIVLVIKLLVSPQSPIGAYFAVAFQGLAAIMVFVITSKIKTGAMILAVLSMLESAVQKVIITTMLFGTGVWKAIDQFADHVSAQLGWISFKTNASFWLIVSYLTIYLLSGVLIGWYAGSLPVKLAAFAANRTSVAILPESGANIISKPNRRYKLSFQFLLIPLLIVVYLFDGGESRLSYIIPLLRVAAIMIAWYFIIAPLMFKALNLLLRKKQSQYHDDIQQAISFFPVIRGIVNLAWHESKDKSFIKKWPAFGLCLIGYTLLYQPQVRAHE